MVALGHCAQTPNAGTEHLGSLPHSPVPGQGPQMLAPGQGPNAGTGAQDTDPKSWHWGTGHGDPRWWHWGYRGQTPSLGTGVLGTDPKYWRQTPGAGTGVQGRDPKWCHWDTGHRDPKCWHWTPRGGNGAQTPNAGTGTQTPGAGTGYGAGRPQILAPGYGAGTPSAVTGPEGCRHRGDNPGAAPAVPAARLLITFPVCPSSKARSRPAPGAG